VHSHSQQMHIAGALVTHEHSVSPRFFVLSSTCNNAESNQQTKGPGTGIINVRYLKMVGVRGSVVVKALCYKPEGRGFETR
jgi:hypothetical protein